jgi:hypothetical protein
VGDRLPIVYKQFQLSRAGSRIADRLLKESTWAVLRMGSTLIVGKYVPYIFGEICNHFTNHTRKMSGANERINKNTKTDQA